MNKFFAYVCDGCSHTTIVDKNAKTKTIYCASCGEKTEMNKMGECSVLLVKQPNIFYPIR